MLIEHSTPSRCAFLIGDEEMKLTEKEAHCVARLLQSALFGKNIFDGCAFCKFKCKTKSDHAPHLDEIRMKFMDATNVDLGYRGSRGILEKDSFQYDRFLKKSNEEVKEQIRRFFQIGISGALI